jgi:glycosyltransferase involved in cell wall biosynthesis
MKHRIAMVSPWQVRSSIAEYAASLVESLRPRYDIRIFSEPHPDGGLGENGGWRDRADLDRLLADLRGARCDLVHLQHLPALFPPDAEFHRLLDELKRDRVPVAVTIHLMTGVPSWARAPDLLIVHGPAAERALRDEGVRTPCRTIPFPVPLPPDLPPALTVPHPAILRTVGFIRPNKGIEDGIRTLGLLSPEIDVRYEVEGLPVAGGQDYPDRLEQTAADLGVRDRFMLRLRFVPREQIVEAWRHATVGLMPYRCRGIASSAAVIDALAADIPVVTSRHVFFDGLEGAVVQTAGPDEMAGAVRRILTDEPLRRRLAAARRALARARTRDRQADEHARAYEALLGR